MQHFPFNRWADYVRGVATPEQRSAMQQHLDSGCAECASTAKTCDAVMQFAQKEHLSDPPSSVLQVVQAYYGLITQLGATEGVELATLAFDSLQEEPIGERGTHSQISRQLLFKSGTFCVDVRLEPKPGSNYVVMFGQVIDANKPLKGFEHVPVSLLSHGAKISETTTNQFGEFHFGFDSVPQMQLFLGLQQKALVVPLPHSQPVAA